MSKPISEPTFSRVWCWLSLGAGLCLQIAQQAAMAGEPHVALSFRQLKDEVAHSARETSTLVVKEFGAGRQSGLSVYRWSKRRLFAEFDLSRTDRAQSARGHLRLMEEVDADIKARVAKGEAGLESYLAGDYYRGDAEITVQREMGKQVGSLKTSRDRRLAAAQLLYDSWHHNSDVRQKERSMAGILYWSRRILEHETEKATDSKPRSAALMSFLQRTKEIEAFVERIDESPPPTYVYELRRDAARADLMAQEGSRDRDQKKCAERADEWLKRAKQVYAADWDWTTRTQNTLYLESLYDESCEWRVAALTQARDQKERIAVNEQHLNRLQELALLVQSQKSSSLDLWATTFYVLQARLWLAEENLVCL